MISAFLQCSVFNFYVISYKTKLLGETVNRTDERFRKNEGRPPITSIVELSLYLLQWIYQFVYGWQDRIVFVLDTFAYNSIRNSNPDSSEDRESLWYADKKFLSLTSPLCFGTQIMILSIFTFSNNLEGFLWFTIFIGNGYTALILFAKVQLLNARYA